uniref:Reverse transcriptase/retrotransposon-derived protein RNase H-like domain-containing protein n=1 Tax=Chromera velia CCMP2878 TaxID=1169474 RepID=A0A0K6S675_9ALVE|eukprot:Cvel_16592.t2-p1 / transcript=Cvel_16592.t2 / gene=Cvel_16592 / organism=Chromera_velia_CCMP2878 / gene_product=hypothetical protein / transcript_product=hypothetical protein / location=Cvel_scaffold1285:6341-9841(+) / protein_length=432 / sequence_SO=supercontig / SO=protein_coding / is_pseudo=false
MQRLADEVWEPRTQIVPPTMAAGVETSASEHPLLLDGELPRACKIKEPSVFAGDRHEVSDWLKDMKEYCQGTGVLESRWLFVLKSYLSKTLKKWVYRKQKSVTPFRSFEDFAEALKKRYIDLLEQDHHRDTLDELRYSKAQSMESFGDVFLDLMEEIKDTSTPADLIHTFKKAIPDAICLEMNKKAPSTLEEPQAVEAAYIYSHITAPLEFVWSEVCEAAFKELKEKIAELIFLVIPNPTCPFDLYVDASEKEICIAAALMQWDSRVNGLRVVALASRKLVQAEQKYPIREKELLAAVFGVKTFHIYVNHTTKVYSDHESLKWLGTSWGLIEGPDRVKRWGIFLNALCIVSQYISGSKNVVTDALSCRPSRTGTQKQTGEERSDEKKTDRIAQVKSTRKVCPDVKFLDQVRKGYAQDFFFKELLLFFTHAPI